MKETDWHNADIVAALRKRGTSLAALSVEAGLSPATLKNALRVSYPKAESIIAKAIGVDASTIWPSRFLNREQKHVDHNS